MRLCRRRLGLSESEVSKILNCSQQQVNVIEAGKSFGKYFAAYLLYLRERECDLNELFDSTKNPLDF